MVKLGQFNFIKIALVGLAIYSGCAPKSKDDVANTFNPQNNNQNFSYFGDSVNEFEFKFRSRILISSESKPTDEKIEVEIRKALKYTLGKMHKDGSIYGKSKIEILQVSSSGATSFSIVYDVSGKAVFSKARSQYTFYTPYSLKTIYQTAGNKCHAVDPEKIDASNYWYHWNPDIQGCPLEINKHYFKSESTLIPIAATQKTYPEYEKLVINNEFKATIFVGPSSHEVTNWDPEKNDDEGATDFANYKKMFLERGYRSRLLTSDEVNKIVPMASNIASPYVMEFRKYANNKMIRYRLIFSETAFYSQNSKNFHFLLASALRSESMIIYAGHSGIGRNLNLNMIESERKMKITLSEKYQIMFFGSCLPYAYYMDMFFSRKVNTLDPTGTKNLEILGYAKEGHFGNKDSYRLIGAVNNFLENGYKTSYQEIVSNNPVDFFGVIGDEDNAK